MRSVPFARLALLLALAALLPAGSCSWAFTSGSSEKNPDGGGTVIIVGGESATFGGWFPTRVGTRPGVLAVTRGWEGDGPLPWLGTLLAGFTGHVHATRVRFDPVRISYAELVAAVRAERLARPSVTVFTESSAQRDAARAQFPAGAAPLLRLRSAGHFTPAR